MQVRSQSQTSREAVQALRSAVAAGDAARVEQLLSVEATAPAAEAVESAATQCMHQERWQLAALLFGHLAKDDPSCQARHRLSRNLAALQCRRPNVYRTLLTARQNSQCELTRSPAGAPTILQRLPGGQATRLTVGDDPARAVASYRKLAEPVLQQGRAIALAGVGDGYLLADLARQAPDLPHGTEVAVWLLEPDPEVLLTCFMIHDYTGEQGPIEQDRFHWLIGREPDQQMLALIRDQPALPPPRATVTQSIRGSALKAQLAQVGDALMREEEDLKRQVHAHYQSLTAEQLAQQLGPTPPRQPRVLLMTSRFTTVLQHAARDAAEGFEQNGWQARLLIEPNDHSRITSRFVQQVLLEFQPHLVLTLDHLRHENGQDVFPPNLPFVCWIQDNLPNLISKQAGRAIGQRDFVLTSAEDIYCERFDYPRRQCIYLNKLTRVPPRPARWTSDGEDLVFVSNGGQVPQELARTMAPKLADAGGEKLVADLARRLIERYEQGQAVMSVQALEPLLVEAERRTGRRVGDPVERQALLQRLFDSLSNTLYRQQALHWAIEIAEAKGLRVGLYGHGWDEHPDFQRYARGPVAYGRDLEELTRRAKICLQIVPYFCLHQRLLDGLVAGGFFLVRLYEPEMTYWRLMQFLRHQVPGAPPEAGTLGEALRRLDQPQRQQLKQLLQARAQSVGGHGQSAQDPDPVQVLRRHEATGSLFALDLPPRLEETGFTDATSLRQRIERFIEDPDLRRQIADEQRQFVEAHHTYAAGMQRILQRVRHLIEAEGAEA